MRAERDIYLTLIHISFSPVHSNLVYFVLKVTLVTLIYSAYTKHNTHPEYYYLSIASHV